MRIIIIANSCGGLYKFRKELILEMINHSWGVYLVVPQSIWTQSLKDLGCQWIPFEFNRRGVNPMADLWQIHRYRKILRNVQPDMVLTYTIKPNIYGGIACQKERIPYITTITGLGDSIENGGLLAKISMALYRKGISGAKCVFFQNIANQCYFINSRIIDKERTRVVSGSGVNLDMFPFEPYPEEKNGLKFLFVGRIMRDKGFGELLKAINILHNENPLITMDVVGDYEEKEWKTLLQANENAGAIHYHGYQTDIRPFYSNAHCIVLPSYHEGMANVLLEASATGRPVIATNVPGCQETFNENVTGFGCRPKDTDSLLEAMHKFIALSMTEHIKMGLSARKKMIKEFDRKVIVKAYMDKIMKIE